MRWLEPGKADDIGAIAYAIEVWIANTVRVYVSRR
jgi:hypothetical protein